MSNAILYGAGLLVAAEATGVTNFSGQGAGGDSVNVEVPTKAADAPIPGAAGGSITDAFEAVAEASQPSKELIEATGPSDQLINAATQSPLEGLDLEAMMEAATQPVEIVNEVPTSADEVKEEVEEKTKEEIEEEVEEKKEEIKEKVEEKKDELTDSSGDDTSGAEDLGDATSDFIWGMAKDPAHRLDEDTWLDGGGVDNTKDVGNAVKEFGKGTVDWLVPGDHSDEVTTEPGGKADEGPLTNGSPEDYKEWGYEKIQEGLPDDNETGSYGPSNTDTTGDGEEDTYIPESLGSGFA